jgi:hypothetical protein
MENAMIWESWGPTLVSVITAIFMAGMMYGKIKDHGEHLARHDTEIEDVKTRLGAGEIEVAKLQSWRDGYNAASAKNSA